MDDLLDMDHEDQTDLVAFSFLDHKQHDLGNDLHRYNPDDHQSLEEQNVGTLDGLDVHHQKLHFEVAEDLETEHPYRECF